MPGDARGALGDVLVRLGTLRRLGTPGTFGDAWGRFGAPGDSWGRQRMPGDVWGRLATPGDAWGRLGTPGDAWGRLGTPGDACSSAVLAGGQLMEIINSENGDSPVLRSYCKSSIFWALLGGTTGRPSRGA